jgi:hypothetical protein
MIFHILQHWNLNLVQGHCMSIFCKKVLVTIQCGAIFLSILAVLGLISPSKTISCPKETSTFELIYEGEFNCVTRGWVDRKTIIQFLGQRSRSNSLKIALKEKASHSAKIYFQGVGNLSEYSIYDNPSSLPLATSATPGTGWSLVNKVAFTLELPSNIAELTIAHGENGDMVEMSLPSITPYSHELNKVKVLQKMTWEEDSKYFYYAITFIILGVPTWLFWMSPESRSTQLWFISTVLFLTTMYAGIPFGSNAGWIDTYDDTSYFHWAYNIGYRFDPFLSKDLIRSEAALFNTHSWGSGILLGAPLGLLRAVSSGNIPPTSTVVFATINATSIFLSFGSVILNFLAFSRLLNARLAALCALMTLLATSMLKWTFMRNVFSHSPEAFCLSAMTYLLIIAYKEPSQKTRSLIWYFIIGILLTQVRREDVLFLLVPAAIQLSFWTTKREFVLITITSLLSLILSLAVLRSTNFFVGINDFWREPTGSLLHFKNFFAYFEKNAFGVAFSSNYGLFAWWNIPAWLAILCAHTQRRYWVIVGSLSVFVLGYMVMCIIHDFPSGVEWQNRFLVKLNPIIFLGAGIFLQGVKTRLAQFILFLGLIFTILYEIILYSRQIPAGMSFYRDFVTDAQIASGRYVTLKQTLFFLPLLAIAGITSLLGLQAIRKISKSIGEAQDLGIR